MAPPPFYFETGAATMKPNYGFAKRQRELAKKQKKEEKKLRKQAEEAPQAGAADAPAASPPAGSGAPQDA
jgi:hypothetical protein